MPTARAPTTRIYLSPGFLGFAKLAGFDYLQHIREALAQRFERRDRKTEIRVVDVHPSASIRRRSARLAKLVAGTCGDDDGPIHLLGHSTGGLDLRLVTSPTTHLDEAAFGHLHWLERVASVTSMNTPHYGTPLASVFATPNGERLLYAITAITIASLRLGAPPLAVTAALVAALARTGEWAGLENRLTTWIKDTILQALDPEASEEVQAWMAQIQDDQGAVVQLTPEAMDLFAAAVEDRPGLRYQCTASYAPPSTALDWVFHLGSPWPAISAGLFHVLYSATSDQHPRYPCAPEDGGDDLLHSLLNERPAPEANDGMVPLRSQLWGEPVWIGKADHLDVVGYFDRKDHHGWLTSGANFNSHAFDTMLDRIVDGMLKGESASR